MWISKEISNSRVYRFFVDIEGNLQDAGVKNALRGIGAEAQNFKILGNY